jgi:hypothetical protein
MADTQTFAVDAKFAPLNVEAWNFLFSFIFNERTLFNSTISVINKYTNVEDGWKLKLIFCFKETSHRRCTYINDICYSKIPNVVVERLTYVFCIQEVLCSNLYPETSFPDWGLSWISTVLPGKCRDSTLKLRHNRFFPYPFQFIIHVSSFYSMLCSLNCCESVVKWSINTVLDLSKPSC